MSGTEITVRSEQGAAAFQSENVKKQQAQAKEVEDLKTKLRRKNGVIAELTEENIGLKKGLGEI